MTYEEAARLFATCRDHYAGKPLQNNTRLFKRGDDFAVRLHGTDVVTIHPDGTYTIRTGGWWTMTTKQRIASYSPIRIFSVRGDWRVRTSPSGTYYWNSPIEYVAPGDPGRKEYLKAQREWNAANQVPFKEGMRVDGNGIPVPENVAPIRKVKVAGVNADGMPQRTPEKVAPYVSEWYTPPVRGE